MSIESVRALVDAAPRFVPPLRDEPPSEDAGLPHPLTRFVDLDLAPRPPRMVIPGFVQDGVVVIAGAHGVGKTTVLVPLAMVVAGLHAGGDPLGPRRWRHVIYIAEDVDQVVRIVTGFVAHGGLGIDPAMVRERFHVVPALRMPAEEVADVGPLYAQQFTRTVDGVDLPPLVVVDTRSATVEVLDENDNAEASRIVALFKQRFAGLPLWLVGHLAKALLSRKDVQALSLRGAGAIEADAHQTMFLVAEDDGRRFLVLGKRRFEPRWTELEVAAGTADVTALDEFGEPAPLTLRWGVPVPPTQTRAEARQDAEEAERVERQSLLRGAILDAVEAAERAGVPLSRRGAIERVGGRAADAGACVSLLEDELWLYAVSVPSAMRTNPRRGEFLIRLSDAERRALIDGQPLPAGRLAVPESWRRADDSQRESTGAEERCK